MLIDVNQNVLLVDIYKNVAESGATSLDARFRVMSIKAQLTLINQKSLQCSKISLYVTPFTRVPKSHSGYKSRNTTHLFHTFGITVVSKWGQKYFMHVPVLANILLVWHKILVIIVSSECVTSVKLLSSGSAPINEECIFHASLYFSCINSNVLQL